MESNAAAYFKQALAKFRSQDVKGGLDDLEEALRLDPSRWEYWWTRGAFNYRRRAYTQAESDLTRAIERCPEVKRVEKIYKHRMFSYGRLNLYDRLVQDATWLVEHGFHDGIIYLWRGWGKYKMGDLDSAIEDYSRAVDLLPKDLHIRLERASLYYKTERYNEALDDFNYILRPIGPDPGPYLDQSAAFAFQHRALIFYRLGNLEQSLDDYNRCRRILGIGPCSNAQFLADGITEHLIYFSGLPFQPHDGYVLKRIEMRDE